MVVTLHGPRYSVYVRIARLTLAEKGVPYDQVEFDVFDPDDIPADYLDLHPFTRVPALEHDGFRLYETQAITRYIDEAFEGPALQPRDPRARARVNQTVALLDNYAYWPWVRTISVQRAEDSRAPNGESGGAPDEKAIAAAVAEAKTGLAALARLHDGQDYLAGAALSLADLHAVPMFDYFLTTGEGQRLLAPHAGLAAWWARMQERPSFHDTRPDSLRG